MKRLGGDFGRTPFGLHQVAAVAARARARRRFAKAFGNFRAGALNAFDDDTRRGLERL